MTDRETLFASRRGGERADARQGCTAESPYLPLRETVATVDGRKLVDGIGSLTFPAPAPVRDPDTSGAFPEGNDGGAGAVNV